MGTKDDVILYILNVDIKVKLLRGFVCIQGNLQ